SAKFLLGQFFTVQELLVGGHGLVAGGALAEGGRGRVVRCPLIDADELRPTVVVPGEVLLPANNRGDARNAVGGVRLNSPPSCNATACELVIERLKSAR